MMFPAATSIQLILEGRVKELRALSQRVFPAMQQESTVLGWNDARLSDQSRTKAFGFSGKFGIDGGMVSCPISYPFYLVGLGGHDYLPNLSQGGQDPTIPDEQDQGLMAGMMADALPTTMTLRQATERLAFGAKVQLGGALKAQASVEDAVADKTVNIFGASYASDAQHLLQAVTDIYGLRLTLDDKHQYAITLPRPRPVDAPADLPREIQRLTPQPLKRALDGQSQIIREKPQSIVEDHGSLKPQQLALLEQSRQRSAKIKAANAYYFPAVRRLIALAKPSVPTATSPSVPVSSLAPESDRLIALIMLSGTCLNQLVNLQDFVPPDPLLHRDKAILLMAHGKVGERDWVTVLVKHRDVNGRLIGDGGSALSVFRSSEH